MPPKVKKKLQVESATDQVVAVESGNAVIPMDPYKDLRYTPTQHEPQPRRKLKTVKVPVRKKRQTYERDSISQPPLSQVPSMTVTLQKLISSTPTVGQFTTHSLLSSFKDKSGAGVPNFLLLDSRAGAPPPLTVWKSPGEMPLTRPPPDVLCRRIRSGHQYRQRRKESQRREVHSLAHFEQMKRQQLHMENFLMAKVKKRRGDLLLRRYQILPRIEPDGRERIVVRKEHCETPPPEKLPIVNLFNYSSKENQWRGLSMTMTRRQRGHNVITEWLGTPHLTDPISRELIAPINDTSVKRLEGDQRKTWPQPADSTEFVPLFPGLAVVGLSYKEIQESHKMAFLFKSPAASSSRGEQHQPQQNHSHQRLAPKTSRTSGATNAIWASSTDVAPPTYNRGVVLHFGESYLTWCAADSERAKRSYTVEVGCTAELGASAVSSAYMTNAGSVVINYNWVRCDQKDTFNLNRYSSMRFAFDCWGGVILPGETHRVPCLYKANEPGYFSEDWRLVTRPVLEGGAPIILRLWGVTRKQDTSRRDRDNIEEKLRTLITRALVEQRVTKIIDHLPLKEIPLRDTRFPLVHLGPDLFQLKNPYFKYHSASVHRLGKLIEIFETQLSLPVSGTARAEASSFSIASDFQSTTISEYDGYGASIAMSEAQVFRGGSVSMQAEGVSTMSMLLAGDALGARQTVGPPDSESEQVEETDSSRVSVVESAASVCFADEFSPQKLTGTVAENILYLKKVFKRRTDLDKIHLQHSEPDSRGTRAMSAAQMLKSRLTLQSSDPEPRASRIPSTHSVRNRIDSTAVDTSVTNFVNIVDPDFYVDTLRRKILENPRLEIQEAAFDVMNAELNKLSFRVQEPMDNWKQTMGLTYLAYAMDSFSDFANRLKEACCKGQYEEELAQKRELETAVSETTIVSDAFGFDGEDAQKEPEAQSAREDGNKNNVDEDATATKELTAHPNDQVQPVQSSAKSLPRTESFPSVSDKFVESCLESNPREKLKPERFKDQYYNRLHTRMYDLLSDFVETMDRVWASKQVLKMDLETELGFTKITDIHRGANFEDYMEAPLPPEWIRLAQKMDALAAANKKRGRYSPT